MNSEKFKIEDVSASETQTEDAVPPQDSRSATNAAIADPLGVDSESSSFGRKVNTSSATEQETASESSAETADTQSKPTTPQAPAKAGRPAVETATAGQATQGEPIKGEGYSIAPRPYTNKQGKTLDAHLVKFDRELAKEERSAMTKRAREAKGWHDKETGGFMLRSQADAEAVGNQAEAVASQVESQLEDAGTEQDAKRLDSAVEREIERVNEQLALLGHYEADPSTSPLSPYNALKAAEKKLTQDAHRLATQLAADLGVEIDPKDEAAQGKYGYGSAIARCNLSTEGEGYITINAPLREENNLLLTVYTKPFHIGENGEKLHNLFKNDKHEVRGIRYVVEKNNLPAGRGHTVEPSITYNELLTKIRAEVGQALGEGKAGEGNHTRSYHDGGLLREPDSDYGTPEGDIRLREVEVEVLDERFNRELEMYSNGALPAGHRFELGSPSLFLMSSGFPMLPITMRATLLGKKSAMERHPFEPMDLKGLVTAMQKPIAVFEYTKPNMRNVIVDITRGGKHFLVGMTLNYKAGDIEVNSVSGLFPKDNMEWLKWIQDGKAIRIDQKEKVQSLIDIQRTTNTAESERIGLNLDDVAKVVNSFENPPLETKEHDEYMRQSSDECNR